jgi:ferric-dicitrate binding protein FerR (iron transport regulator)
MGIKLMDKQFYISELIVKTNNGTISDKEREVLDAWLKKSEENLKIYNKATDNKYLIDKLEVYQLFRKNEVRKSLENELFTSRTIWLVPKTMLRYAAVIVPFIIMAGISWYYLKDFNSPNLSSLDSKYVPGSQKATLVLSDGQVHELDRDNILSEMKQGEARIVNKLNSLIYSAEDEIDDTQTVIHNELITPRGGGYTLQLADGSVVTLNAGSSLRYPVSFTDSIRQVFLKGEAYFDVYHDSKPFIVSCDDIDVQVLGTSFNISTYPDDPDVKTTLVEGKVKITTAGEFHMAADGKVLVPNEQAIFNRKDAKIEIMQVNAAQFTSWIQGKFEFKNSDLDQVMKKLARWYDFEYRFESIEAKDYHFTARLNNDQSISSILEMLEMTTDVKFEIKDQTIVIL